MRKVYLYMLLYVYKLLVTHVGKPTFPQTMPESKIPSALHRGLHHLRQWELSGLSPSLRPSMMYSITRNLRQKPVHSLVN